MSPPRIRSLLALGLFALALMVPKLSAQQPAPFDPNMIKNGMTAEDVRNRLGPPKSMARQILYGRFLEQWTYDAPAVRIEFDWRKGEPKTIQNYQFLTQPPR